MSLKYCNNKYTRIGLADAAFRILSLAVQPLYFYQHPRIHLPEFSVQHVCEALCNLSLSRCCVNKVLFTYLLNTLTAVNSKVKLYLSS